MLGVCQVLYQPVKTVLNRNLALVLKDITVGYRLCPFRYVIRARHVALGLTPSISLTVMVSKSEDLGKDGKSGVQGHSLPINF